jgi:hypothetical protein
MRLMRIAWIQRLGENFSGSSASAFAAAAQSSECSKCETQRCGTG